MPQTDYSSNYLLYNQQVTKNLVIAVEIEGLGTVLTSSTLYTRVRYGDPGIKYGDAGLVYGGLRVADNFLAILDLNGGSLTLSQRLEPEQGRGAISTLSMSFIDKDQFMTQLISPGILLDDILGKPVKVYVGYQQISFPEDFTVIFRGRVSAYNAESGRITLQFSDPNMVRRQQILYMGKTVLASPITAAATAIPVVSNADFFQHIQGPDGSYDPGIQTYIKIGEEFIRYPASGYGSNAFNYVTRGARDTVAASAEAGADVTAAIEITDHAIDMALKLMLSGWNGPYLEGLPISSFVYSPDSSIAAASGLMVLGAGKSADRDYGIAVGDYLTVSNDAVSGNNGQARVLQLLDTSSGPANAIVTDKAFTFETAPTGTFAIRSQFDTYPIAAGVKLPGYEVDVAQHLYIKDTFMGSDENRLRFFFESQEDSCKTFIENQIYLPTACYSLSRFGRLSLQLTHAPIADQRLQILDGDNVLNPQSLNPNRGVNNRKFFNQINWEYDFDDAGEPTTKLKAIDSDSTTIIGVTTVLPISARGIRTDFGTQTVIDRRTNYLLSRYKNGAVIITVEVNWEVGSLIEAGDVVAVKDGGVLQVSNFVTGSRNLGTQLFEVIDRQLDMKSGKVRVQLVSGLGAEVTDRYATISPSSIIQAGSSQTELVIADSFGALYPSQEYRKWQDYTGLRVKIHTEDYTASATATLVSLNSANPNRLNVSGLGIAPTAGMILDIDDYSESTDPLDQQTLKAIHAYHSPHVMITAGVSASAFQVAPSAVTLFQVGFPIKVHNDDFSQSAPETTVANINTGTNTITAASSFGFTPASGYSVDLLGFPDGTASYRWV